MIVVLINALAVVIGGGLGLVARKRVKQSSSLELLVFNAIGVITLIIGLSMALETQRVLYLAISLVLGGVLGSVMGIETAISGLGRRLHSGFGRTPRVPDPEGADGFARGFLEASILFCVGAMSILGSIQAGAQAQYGIILTKSIMDGTVAIFMTAALGPGVIFSAVSILVYQGALTLASVFFGSFVPPLVLSEISGVGGGMLIMVAINLLGLKKIATGDFIPALLISVLLSVLDPYLPDLLKL